MTKEEIMKKEIKEEIRQIKTYFEDNLDEYDYNEIRESFGNMFMIGFNKGRKEGRAESLVEEIKFLENLYEIIDKSMDLIITTGRGKDRHIKITDVLSDLGIDGRLEEIRSELKKISSDKRGNKQ